MRLAYSAILVTFGVVGCTGVNCHVQGYSCSDLAETFFRKPTKVAMTDFTNFGIDQQYAIYICGNQYMHPPMIHLAEPFASEGARVVPFLRARLSEAEDDLTVRDIVAVFSEMRKQKTYDVAGDSELITIMEEKVSRMKNSEWKRLVERHLDKFQ